MDTLGYRFLTLKDIVLGHFRISLQYTLEHQNKISDRMKTYK